MMKSKKLATCIGVAILSGPAVAQQLEEVVVTAQKREQNAMDVPVAVSVLGTDALENLDVQNFVDVARVSPSLTVQGGDNPNNSTIRMRGIGTDVFSVSAEASVSVVVDDVALLQTSQAFNNLMDIERVEVLRGPQGTLFGKNASAGVVNIVTQAPTEEFTARFGVRFTDDDEQKGEMSLSGPITENLGYRISGYVLDRDGFVENLEDGSDLNGEESYGVRGKLLWEPSDNLDMTLILDKSNRDASNMATLVVEGAEPIEGIKPGEDNRKVRLDTDHGFEMDQEMVVFKLNYDFGEHLFTSITSYQELELDQLIDGDRSTDKVPPAFTGLNPGGYPDDTPTYEATQLRESDGFQQEFRLTSTGSEKFEYMLGAFYSDIEHYQNLDRYAIIFILDNWEADASTESMALFGQGSLQLADSTYLDLGLRFNREEIDLKYTVFVDTIPGGPFQGLRPGLPETYTGDDSDDAVTGKIALRHFLANDAMVFGSVSTGYKGMAYDISSGFTQEKADNPVDPENSINYEIGIKGMSEDGSFRYEAVAFLTDFEDYQAQGSFFDGEVINFQLENVGELRSKGIEVDLAYQATDSLRLDFSGAWIDATIEEFPNAECYFGQTEAEGCVPSMNDPDTLVQDLGGADLNNSPEFKFNAGVYWEHQAGNMPFNWFALGNYQWQDDVNFDLYGQPTNAQDAYGIANFGLGIVEPAGRYQVTLFVNNAFDERFAMGYDDRQDRGQGVAASWVRESQRYWGIKASYAF